MFRLALSNAARTASIARPASKFQTGAFARWASTLPRADVESRVLSVFETYTQDKSNLSTSSTFKDLGLDSLDAVELMVAVEEEFGIEIPDKESDEIRSVKDAVDYISAQPEAR